MENKLASPFILLRHAWTLAIARPAIASYVILGAAPQLILFTFSAISTYIIGTDTIQTFLSDLFSQTDSWIMAINIVIGLVVVIFVSVVSTWYTAILYHVYQATAAGSLAGLSTYMKPAKQVTLHLLVTYIVVGFITMGGFLLLIIPGAVVAVRYMFAPTVAAVEDRAIKPIAQSKQLVKGRFWELVGRGIVVIACYNVPLSLLQNIHPVLGMVWAVTSPVFGLYFFLVYLDFKRTTATAS